MSTPGFKRLANDTFLGRLSDLRNAVTPILAGNYLPSFTDHSITHSDHVCELIDLLTESLVGERQLNDREAFVLYASAYLHDVGLQHQRAEETQIVRSILQKSNFSGRAWRDLEKETRLEIVRSQHHRISGEMIRQSIDAPQPTVLGVQMTEDWHPGQIRSLCIAHNLYMDSHDKQEYIELTQDWGEFRMTLLSALLRLADILDESRRRSQLYLERTRELNIESRLHWWRHYYVAEVHIDPQAHHISLWFDFPVDRRPQYQTIIPPLQLPFLEAEFARHSAVLARNNMPWHLESLEVPAAQSTSRAMDGELEQYVLEKLAQERRQRAERDKLLVLDQLQSERPTIRRKLLALRANDNLFEAGKQLREFRDLAKHLWRLGGQRDAWIMLWGEFTRLSKSADLETKATVGIELAEMMLNDGVSERAVRLLHGLVPEAELLESPLQFRFLRLLGEAYLGACAYAQAKETLSRAAKLTQDDQLREEILAELDEASLLQGELKSASNDIEKGI